MNKTFLAMHLIMIGGESRENLLRLWELPAILIYKYYHGLEVSLNITQLLLCLRVNSSKTKLNLPSI